MGNVSIYTESELVKFSSYDDITLAEIIANHSPNRLMNIIKEMRIALTTYSKKHKMDYIQECVLVNINIIENMCRRKFKAWRKNELKKRGVPEYMIKKIIRKEYDQFYKKYAVY